MREKIITLNKQEGETPLECLNRFRTENQDYSDAVLSYVGRLDPMASGALLVVVDEENKNRHKYLGFDKVYEVDVLFGIKTDTGDILGKVTEVKPMGKILSKLHLASFVGEFKQLYPMYSSKRQGWVKKVNTDSVVEVPEKVSTIYSIKELEKHELEGQEILSQVYKRISKVKGDFRQAEILEIWDSLDLKNHTFYITRLEVSCSSGTYMRTLAEVIGEKASTVALAWKINRTQVKPMRT